MLAHSFVMRPRMTMQEAARAMGISFRAAQAVMDKFLESGLVREDTGRRRDRIYVCDNVMFVGQLQP
jgi:predicted transcriptional regulator